MPKPDDDRDLTHLHVAVSQLAAAGYERYEISNFARPGAPRATIWPTGETPTGSASVPARTPMRVGLARRTSMTPLRMRTPSRDRDGDRVGGKTSPAVALFDALMMGLRLARGRRSRRRSTARLGVDARVPLIAGGRSHAIVVRGLLDSEGTRLRLTTRGSGPGVVRAPELPAGRVIANPITRVGSAPRRTAGPWARAGRDRAGRRPAGSRACASCCRARSAGSSGGEPHLLEAPADVLLRDGLLSLTCCR